MKNLADRQKKRDETIDPAEEPSPEPFLRASHCRRLHSQFWSRLDDVSGVCETQLRLETRLQHLNATVKQRASSTQSSASSSSSDLRKVFTHSVSYQQLQMPADSAAYSTDAHSTQSSERRQNRESGGDPDMIAKTVLREINDEIEQLGLTAPGSAQRSPDDQDSTVQFLTEKYIDARLSVNKIAREAAPPHHLGQQSEAGADKQLWWQNLRALTPQQHEMLRKLTRVQSAKRLERGMPTIGRLEPNQQQQIVWQLHLANKQTSRATAKTEELLAHSRNQSRILWWSMRLR